MQPKISIKRSLFIVSIAGIALSSILIFFLTLGLPTRGSYTTSTSPADNQTPQNLIDRTNGEAATSPEQGSLGLPIRLMIPKINVDALVEYVGLTSDGAMDVPKERSDVAWFELGQRPGETGSAVIAGHYGRWKTGEKSVFDDLNTLRKGDELYVEDDKGVITTFVMRESRDYDPKADASDVFGSNDGQSHLNLVTCEGVWNTISKSYPRRLVVFTDKKME